MENAVKMTQTGNLGERLVAAYYRGEGYLVEESLHTFDSEKDLLIDGKTCEVKTQQAYHVMNAMTAKKNQLRKMMEADYLVFVETPNKRKPSDKGKIWLAPEKDKRKFFEYFNKNIKQKMIGISKHDLTLLATINDPLVNSELRQLSISKW